MRAALHANFDDSLRRIADRFLVMLCICLLGYALIGRGFAYVGIPPLFIGEICLVIGLGIWMTTRGWTRVFHVAPAIGVLPLVIWGLIRTVPFVGEYQIDAVRDAVLWGYSLFALVVASLIVASPSRLPRLLGYYQKFYKIFLIVIPIVYCFIHFARDVVPRWPGVNTPMMQVKEGDVLVHLAGILAFWVSDPRGTVRWGWTLLMALDMALMGVIDRAGLVTFGAVMMLCMIAKPRHATAWRTIGMMLCGVVVLWGTNLRVEVPGGKGRDISFQQFYVNFLSTFGQDKNNALEGTKEWRVEWWHTIIDYTVHGPYFWAGKGFGINLADDDGFQVYRDRSLRTPHNVHMTVLARMGVTGVVVWGTAHLVWLFSIADGYVRAFRRKNHRWEGLFFFLFAYYLAFLINGSFDVFLEGPMGGIWFWSIFGFGVGALWCYRNCPEILDDEVESDEGSSRTQFLPTAGWRGPGLPVGTGAARIIRP